MPFFVLPVNSRSWAARNMDLFSRSFGASFSLVRTLIMSLISRTGPIPFPIGSLPSVKTTFIFKLNFFASCSKDFFSFMAFIFETFADFP